MIHQELKDVISEFDSLRELISAFSQEVRYLSDQIKKLNELVGPQEQIANNGERMSSIGKPIPLDSPLEEIGIAIRASNALYRFGIRTVGDLCDMTYHDILKVPKLGKTSIVKSILPSLHKYGLSLREEGDI